MQIQIESARESFLRRKNNNLSYPPFFPLSRASLPLPRHSHSRARHTCYLLPEPLFRSSQPPSVAEGLARVRPLIDRSRPRFFIRHFIFIIQPPPPRPRERDRARNEGGRVEGGGYDPPAKPDTDREHTPPPSGDGVSRMICARPRRYDTANNRSFVVPGRYTPDAAAVAVVDAVGYTRKSRYTVQQGKQDGRPPLFRGSIRNQETRRARATDELPCRLLLFTYVTYDQVRKLSGVANVLYRGGKPKIR